MQMSQRLARDYGRSDEYTIGQVKTALSKLTYNEKLEEVAIAIWCSEENSKELGLDKASVKKYRGYPKEHHAGIGNEGSCGGSFGDGGD